MSAITSAAVNPTPIVAGNIRLECRDITVNIANNDTYTVVDMGTVGAAWLELDASGVTHGIVLSGTGNRTLTFKVSGACKGKLFYMGQ